MKKIIFVISIVLMVILSVIGLGHLVRPMGTESAFNAIETFHSLPENSVEVIAYGSSHMWRGLNVMEMYEKYGIGAYNYACNWQKIDTTNLFFQDSLETQSPKVVIFDTAFVGEMNINVDVQGEIYYTRALKNVEGKEDYLKQCFGDEFGRYLEYYFPLFAFHENWSEISEQSFMKNADEHNFYNTMGYMYSDNVVEVNIKDYKGYKQDELWDRPIKLLDSIVSKCKEKNIQVIFITIPWEWEHQYFEAMEKYAKENNCVYLNLYEKMEEIGIDCKTDFSDSAHLNDNGAKKVADYIGNYIKTNYDVTDMRTIKDNIWLRD